LDHTLTTVFPSEEPDAFVVAAPAAAVVVLPDAAALPDAVDALPSALLPHAARETLIAPARTAAVALLNLLILSSRFFKHAFYMCFMMLSEI
jgi:hypothetical protein